MNTDKFSDFIKATRLSFPIGHPMRGFANAASNGYSVGKLQCLTNIRAKRVLYLPLKVDEFIAHC